MIFSCAPSWSAAINQWIGSTKGSKATNKRKAESSIRSQPLAIRFNLLKTPGSTFLKPKIVWSDIEGLRHGTFIWLSRNAATHDGNPVISGWADGRYFVPKDIHRFDSSDKLIEIPAPTVDVAQFCLEFAKDFSNFLLLRLSSLGPIEVPRTSIEDIEKSLDSVMVPAFARQIFTAHKSQIERALMLVKSDPIGDAISLLRETVTYCETRLCT